MKSARSAAALGVALCLVLLFGGVAQAQAPVNDTFGSATAVAAVPFNVQVDTSQATTDADDAQLNANCGAPATDASVWFAFTPTVDGSVAVDVSQSDYSAGVLVGVGSQGALNLVACGPGAVGFYAQAGTTYYLLAIDDQADGSGNGGRLKLTIDAVQAPTVSVTVNRTGSFNSRTGSATVSGTYTCTNGDFIETYLNARQNAGRFVVLGFGEFFGFNTCDGTVRPWSADRPTDKRQVCGRQGAGDRHVVRLRPV